MQWPVWQVRRLPPNPTNKQTKAARAEEADAGAGPAVAGRGPPGLAALLAGGPAGRGRGRG